MGPLVAPGLGPPSALALAAATPADARGWLAVGAAYLLGAVPFGLLLARAVKGVDLRTVGSGNIGATNVGRALGRGWAVVAFALDFLKGWVPALLLARLAAPEGEAELLGVWCGAAAVVGHCFPVWLGFRGGKGVATGCGAMVALDPVVFVVGGLAWLGALAAFRFVSLASIAMGLAFPIAAWARGDARPVVAGAALLTLLILVRHRSNMARLAAGTEPRFGERRPPAAEPPGGRGESRP
jgi:glycerol-3-phosphate acyltransferase PlsY